MTYAISPGYVIPPAYHVSLGVDEGTWPEYYQKPEAFRDFNELHDVFLSLEVVLAIFGLVAAPFDVAKCASREGRNSVNVVTTPLELTEAGGY